MTTILLKEKGKKKNKIKYQITFDMKNDKTLAKRFIDILNRNAKHYDNCGGDGGVYTASVIKNKYKE